MKVHSKIRRILAGACAVVLGPIVATCPAASTTQSNSPSALTPAQATSSGSSPFISIVRADFAAWDQDHDGVLEQAELDRLIADPAIKGDHAVAAAVLKNLVHQRQHFHIAAPPLDLAYFGRYESEGWSNRKPANGQELPSPPTVTPADSAVEKPTEKPAEKVAEKSGEAAGVGPADASLVDAGPARPVSEQQKLQLLQPNFDRQFRMLKTKLGRVKYTLFTGASPSQDMIHQGSMGDCFFLSSLGAMIARDPDLLNRMIVPDGHADADGISSAYKVTFPGSAAVTIAPPTDGELAIGAGSAGNGLWLPVMEKAYGALVARQTASEQRTVELLDLIDHGGDPNVALSSLTGHTTDPFIPLHEHKQTVEEFLPKFRERLSKALSEHRLVIVSDPPGHVPPGMVPQHSYAATGYDADSDRIHIWNPLGIDFSPKGPEGLANGYETRHGHFAMPLTDFYSIYRSAVFETNDLAPKPATTQPQQASARSM